MNFYKENLDSIKEQMSNRFDSAIDERKDPFPLGWAGSRSKIIYKNQVMTVPRGIHKLYNLLFRAGGNLPHIYKDG